LDVAERLPLEAATAHSLLTIEHIHRYDFAAALLRGRRVLDLGCGSGYGAKILRSTCVAVHGVDKDVSTIDLAAATIGFETDVTFEAADAHEVLRRSDLSQDFDAIVALETLEHLENPTEAVASLLQLAESGVKLIVSVPNSAALREDNPYHLTDYDHRLVRSTFEGFPNLVIGYQFLAEGSLIRTVGGDEFEARFVEPERGEPEFANHFLICVNTLEELDAAADSANMHLEVAPVNNRYMLDLERANRELRIANARLARHHLGKSDSASATLLARVERLTNELDELRVRVRQEDERRAHEEWIADLHGQIEEHQLTIEAMTSTRAWRLAGRYWRIRERVLRMLGRS
jgi:SAM-dependent methyltransferase